MTVELGGEIFFSTLSDYCDKANDILAVDCEGDDEAADSFCEDGNASYTHAPNEVLCDGG